MSLAPARNFIVNGVHNQITDAGGLKLLLSGKVPHGIEPRTASHMPCPRL